MVTCSYSQTTNIQRVCSRMYLLQADPVGQPQPVPVQAPPVSPSQPCVAVSWPTGELCQCVENLIPDLVLFPGLISPCCPRQCPSALCLQHFSLPLAPRLLLSRCLLTHSILQRPSAPAHSSPQSWQRVLPPRRSCFVLQLLRKSHFSDSFPLVIS